MTLGAFVYAYFSLYNPYQESRPYPSFEKCEISRLDSEKVGFITTPCNNVSLSRR